MFICMIVGKQVFFFPLPIIPKMIAELKAS